MMLLSSCYEHVWAPGELIFMKYGIFTRSSDTRGHHYYYDYHHCHEQDDAVITEYLMHKDNVYML